MTSGAGALSTLSILVVEQDENGPGGLTLALHRAGARVVKVATPVAAIGALSRLQPDAVIADIGLAGGGAIELLAEARRSGFRTPFIAVLDAHDVRNATVTSDGFAAFLRKPIDDDVLVSSLLSVTR